MKLKIILFFLFAGVIQQGVTFSEPPRGTIKYTEHPAFADLFFKTWEKLPKAKLCSWNRSTPSGGSGGVKECHKLYSELKAIEELLPFLVETPGVEVEFTGSDLYISFPKGGQIRYSM